MNYGLSTTVIVVTYNSSADIGNALRSIPSNVTVVVIDNDSSDDTRQVIARDFPTVKLINTGSNLGFAKAVNIGVSQSDSDLVMLLNPDAVLSPGAMERLVEQFSVAPSLGIASPVVTEGDGSLSTAAAGYEPTIWKMFTHASGLSRLSDKVTILRGHYLLRSQIQGSRPTRVRWVSGGCMIFRRAAFDQVGGLSERWFMYAEDVDFCLRVDDAGWFISLVPDATATHEVGASSSQVTHVRTEWLQNLFDLYSTRYGAGAVRKYLWLSVTGLGYAGRSLISRATRDWHGQSRFSAYAEAAWRLMRDTKADPGAHRLGADLYAARYYPVARTAHLERLADSHPAAFFYTRTRQDWDLAQAPAGASVQRVSFLRLMREVWVRPFEILEVPEPLAITLLPSLVVLSFAAKARNRRRTLPKLTLTFYAIENFDQVTKLRSRVRLPRRILQIALNAGLMVVLSEVSRAAFGTAGALETYQRQLGPKLWRRFEARSRVEQFPALASASSEGAKKARDQVCFLGSFEERKGIQRLIAAWPLVAQKNPDATLVVMGHGPLEEAVVAFAKDRGEVAVLLDPSRAVIHEQLGNSHVLTLLSQPTAVWREQIGLPILEGLSHGCEIVTTTETGIATWLTEHGHEVIEHAADDSAIAAAIERSIGRTRGALQIKASLPHIDGRIQADEWMFEGDRASAIRAEQINSTPGTKRFQ